MYKITIHTPVGDKTVKFASETAQEALFKVGFIQGALSLLGIRTDDFSKYEHLLDGVSVSWDMIDD